MLKKKRFTNAFKNIAMVILILSCGDDGKTQTPGKFSVSNHSSWSLFPDEIQSLTIGDKVPDFEFELINHSSRKARFSDFSGKYKILDFWATTCMPCLRNFPKMDSLQKRYGDKLQVLLINTKDTRDNEKKIVAVFDKLKNPAGERYQLPSAINDTITKRFFPHKLLPHYVWIDNKNIIRAITSSDQLTTKNVESFLHGISLQLPLKEDLDFDSDKPLFVNGNGGNNESYIFRSLLTGYTDGLPGAGGTKYNDDGKVIRIFSLNTSILALYQQAYPQMAGFPKNRIVLDVMEPLKYTAEDNWDEWKYDNAYCYELIVPAVTVEKARKLMQDDLLRFFGLMVYVEKRMVKCLALKVKVKALIKNENHGNSETNLSNKDIGPKYMYNRPVSYLVNRLNSMISTPVIDETGYTEKISIEGLPADLNNIKLLNAGLNKYGFELVEEKRQLEFFVLKEYGK